MSNACEIFARRLNNLRCEKGIPQEELANYLYVDKRKISRLESNMSIPDIDILINIAKYFNVSLNYLVGLTDKKEKFPK